MSSTRFTPILIVLLVFLSLLALYTAYDKQTKTLIPEKLTKVLLFTDVSFSLRELNKVVALEAIGLIAVVFLLGPLSKFWPRVFNQFLCLRKPLGLTGFGLAVLHTIYSFVVLYQFDLNKLLQSPKIGGLAAGAIALAIFFFMSLTSTKQAVERLGYRRWKTIQTFGYIGLLAALLHFFLLETKNWALDVRPFGLVFFYLTAVALLLRLGIIFVKVPERKSYEEHIGQK